MKSSERLEAARSLGLPAVWLTATEPFRAGLDVLELWCRLPQLVFAPRGDGHNVVVLPGFATADPMTVALRQFLQFIGYNSMPWGLGFNTGFAALGEDIERLKTKLRQAFEAQDAKVSLIGWSLGGIMARRLAREHPDHVRQVIALGSPFTGNPEAVAIKRIYEWISGEQLSSEEARARFERDRETPSVRTTAIWSRADGITNWRNCREEPVDHARNIEVGGSHLGLTHNADVFLRVAELLAEQT